MNIKRWEIWLANLDPSFGTESGKIRPVLVLQSDLLNVVHFSTAVLPISSKVVSGVHILRFNLNDLQAETGLIQNSDVLLDQITTIDNKRFVKKLGAIEDKTARSKIVEGLKVVLDLE
jgi:mRNA interferase MazF